MARDARWEMPVQLLGEMILHSSSGGGGAEGKIEDISASPDCNDGLYSYRQLQLQQSTQEYHQRQPQRTEHEPICKTSARPVRR